MNPAENKFLHALKRTSKGKKTIPEDIYLKVFKTEFPESFYPETNYNHLLELFESLVNQHKIRLPKSKEHWIQNMNPPIPRWIILQDKPKEVIKKIWKSYTWLPELSWVSRVSRLSKEKLSDLIKLNEFFRELKGQRIVESDYLPIKERSIAIFDDEKKLDNFLGWNRFTQNISLDQLGCYKTQHPFPSKVCWRANSQRTIIIENRDTFDSFWKCNNSLENPPYKNIIYGHGKAIEDWILWIKDFDPKIESIEYFGDLDQEGLNIPRRISQKLIQNSFSITINMALPFYKRLIALHREKYDYEVPVKIKPRKSLSFLPAKDQIYMELIFQQNDRIPQELLNKNEIMEIFSLL